MNNKYKHWGGVQSLISTPFNLQLFANDKLISLDRMRDFLSECKNIFHMESDLANENEISGIVEDQLIPKPVDLSYYAQNHIQDYTSITQIPQENLDYLNSGLVASNMSYMFNRCYKLQSISKLNIDTSKCTDMNHIFYGCQVLTSLDLSNFNTSNVTKMYNMFGNCQALTTIDLSNWDTSKVTDMRMMFGNCNLLEHIEGIIDMKSCTDYRYMFNICSKLSGVKIKNPPNDFNFESEAGLSSSQYEIVS